ncbi:hypothetical protein [Paenibacillus sp. GCM10027626]|uniref:hypothetical protein n=1 Tax=Paenibacillus sp. GCM10027626 TaxID=3273411 RepID=UPI0036293625
MLRKLMTVAGSALLISSLVACGSAALDKETGSLPEVEVKPVADEVNQQQQQSDKAGDVITQEEAKIKFQLEKPEFKQLLEMMKPGPIVPGLAQDLIPQGLDYIAEKDWFIISHYRAGGGPSVLSFVDAKTGEMVEYFHLYDEKGEAYKGHAGGVAVSKKHAWISSESCLYQIKLDDIYAGDSGSKLRFSGRIETDTRASFDAFADGVLWVGEFAHGMDYPVSKEHRMTNRDGVEHNAWIAGYKLEEETDMLVGERQKKKPARPDYILSVTDRIQGIELLEDRIILSQSFGRNNGSEIYLHKNILRDKPHAQVVIDGAEVPVWFLDEQNLISKLEGPPMSESAIVVDNAMYILFESAADKYRDSGSYPLDRIQIVELDKLPAK